MIRAEIFKRKDGRWQFGVPPTVCWGFPDGKIVASTMRQLSWTHFTLLIPLKKPLQRECYAEMGRIEKWTVKTPRSKINGMLYERTAISKKLDQLIKQKIKGLRDDDKTRLGVYFIKTKR